MNESEARKIVAAEIGPIIDSLAKRGILVRRLEINWVDVTQCGSPYKQVTRGLFDGSLQLIDPDLELVS